MEAPSRLAASTCSCFLSSKFFRSRSKTSSALHWGVECNCLWAMARNVAVLLTLASSIVQKWCDSIPATMHLLFFGSSPSSFWLMSLLTSFIANVKHESALNVCSASIVCFLQNYKLMIRCSSTILHATIRQFHCRWQPIHRKLPFVPETASYSLELQAVVNPGRLVCWRSKYCNTQTVMWFIWIWITVSIVLNWWNTNVSICFSPRRPLRSTRQFWDLMNGSIGTRGNTWCVCLSMMATKPWIEKSRSIYGKLSQSGILHSWSRLFENNIAWEHQNKHGKWSREMTVMYGWWLEKQHTLSQTARNNSSSLDQNKIIDDKEETKITFGKT